MRTPAMLGANLLAVILALPTCTAPSQEEPGFVLRDVEVTVLGERLVLSAADGASYELAALEAPTSCPSDDGGTWACGEGSRQALAEAIAGAVLECRVLEDGSPPAVECRAQTRNLNVWLLEVGRAALDPEWRGRFPEYDEAESAARTAGALLWSNSGGEAPEMEQPRYFSPREPARDTASPPLSGVLRNRAPPGGGAAASAAGRIVPGRFLLRGTEGDVRTYELVRPAAGDGVPVEYVEHEQDRSAPTPAGLPRRPGWVPAVGADDLVVHAASGGRPGYARTPAEDGRSALAYVLDSPEAQGRRYSAIALDGIMWSSQRGALQPARDPLESRVRRRGATATERGAIGAGLPEDRLRAGVWTLGAFRVVVAEDPFGCARHTWCRFAVLVDAGVVVSGTAREAPELVAPERSAPAGARTAPEMTGLVWEAPEGGWRVWTP